MHKTFSKNRILPALLALGFCWAGIACAGGNSLSSSQIDLVRRGHDGNGLTVVWNSELGTPTSIKAPDLGAQGLSSGHRFVVQQGGRTSDDTIAVLDNLAGVLRVQNAAHEFRVMNSANDSRGNRHSRVQQRYQGLRVVGGDLVVHFDSNGKARSINGRYVPDINLATNARLSGVAALACARQDAEQQGQTFVSTLMEPELVVFASRRNGRETVTPLLAYELTLETLDVSSGYTGHWRYWIDASAGTILRAYDGVKFIAPGSGSDAAVSGYHLTEEGGSFVNTTGYKVGSNYYLWLPHSSYPWVQFDLLRELGSVFISNGTSSAWTTTLGDRSEISAYENFIQTAGFFKTLFNRVSFDDDGGHMNVFVHSRDVGSSDIDTLWLGDGYSILDILAHEYTHCIIDDEAGFIYDNADSGAFHEGYADIFGTLVEFYTSQDGRSNYPDSTAGTADWLIGEDSRLGRSGGDRALRDLRDPSSSGLSEGRHPSRYKGTNWDPNLEVHENSTVLSHFFYLLCEGGSGTNDGIAFAVTGAGSYPGTSADYYPRTMAYNVLCNRGTPDNDYPEMRQLWLDEAEASYPAYLSRVRAAWDAVGVADSWDPTDDTSTNATLLAAPGASEQFHGTHLLTTGDRYDWFKISMTAGTTYQLEAIDGSGDTYGELYSNSNGTTLVAFDDNSGSNSQFQITYVAQSTRVHYLRVRAETPGEPCDYTLSYSTGPSAALLSLDIAGATNVAENSGSQYSCTAHFSNTTTVDVTGEVTWTNDSVSAFVDSSGFLMTGSVASNTACRITATYNGQSDTHDLTILDVPTPRPDFVINAIRLEPTSPTAGKTFTAYVTVSNAGVLVGKAGSVFVWTNKVGEAAIGESATKSKTIGTLNPGQTATAAVSSLNAAVPGGLTLRAFVDAKGATTETNENNNQATLNYDVLTKPDIAVSSISLNPASPDRGGLYAATVMLKNSGSSNAGGFSVSVWSHLTGTPTNADSADATVWIDSLATNQTLTLPVFTNLPAGTGKTARTFRVLADSGSDLDEVTESNNSSSKSYTPVSKADFVITEISLNPSNPIAGSNFTALVVIRNQGYKSNSGGTLDIWANGDGDVAPSPTNRGDRAVSVSSISVGTQTTFTVTGLVTPTNASCTLRATVDSRAAVSEVIETNNSGSLVYSPVVF